MSSALQVETRSEPSRERSGLSLRRVRIRGDEMIARCGVDSRSLTPPAERNGARTSGFPRASRPLAGALRDGGLGDSRILAPVNPLASDGKPIRLVGIEEPETALHPSAAGALMGALREAATHTQVLVTTQSAGLLDCYDPEEGHLLLVTMSGGVTRIAPIDEASRTVLSKHLDTAGGLLRLDLFEPDPADLARQETSSKSAGENGDA